MWVKSTGDTSVRQAPNIIYIIRSTLGKRQKGRPPSNAREAAPLYADIGPQVLEPLRISSIRISYSPRSGAFWSRSARISS